MIEGVETYDMLQNGVWAVDHLVTGKPMKKVLANGCFDVLHDGHLQHLREARAMGDYLIVSLTEDAFVNKGAGRPINHWPERADMLRELRCVDEVITTRSSCAAIREVRPNVFVKGIDYSLGDKFTEDVAAACREVGAELRYTAAPKQSAKEIITKAIM